MEEPEFYCEIRKRMVPDYTCRYCTLDCEWAERKPILKEYKEGLKNGVEERAD
jgi:hypothetical protein